MSDAAEMIRDALRVVAKHRDSTCDQCKEDGTCRALDRARSIVATPSEW
ncbi:hypothetical protein AB0J90_30060 [Micromonospora sp. NPDC049523]